MVRVSVKVPLWGSKKRFPGKNSNMGKIFNYGVNISGISQGFYTDHDSAPIIVAPDCVVDMTNLKGLTKAISPIPSVIEYFKHKGIKRFFLRRTYAMGDVLMVVPVVRYLRTLGFDPYIKTVNRYFDTLRRLNIEVRPVGFGPDGAGIELDKTVEKDHSCPEMQKYPRIQIYMIALGLNKFPKELDWEYDKKNFFQLKDLSGFKFKRGDYVIFQGLTGDKSRSLPVTTIENLINSLNEEGVKVAYVGTSARLRIKKPEMVEMVCVKYSLSQLFPIFENAKAAIVMDSGPLWLLHFTKTPVVVVLGSTPKTRLVYHPLYPEQATAVEAYKYVNCKPCHQRAKKCNYRIDCLRVSADTLFNDLYPKLREIWN